MRAMMIRLAAGLMLLGQMMVAPAVAQPTGAQAIGIARSQTGALESSERYRRISAAALRFNASDAPAMADPPTITSGTTVTAGLNVVLRPNNTSAASLFTVYGAVPFLYMTDFWRAYSTTRPGGGNVDAVHDNFMHRVAWRTDSASFDIRVLGVQSTVGYRLLVDGQYVSKALLTTATTSGGNYFNVKWPSRQMHRYDLEVERGAAFGGITVSKGDAVQAIDVSSRYRVAIYGDSITATIGSVLAGNGYAYHLGRRLGNMDLDLWAIGISSTGYLNEGVQPGTGTWKFISHVDDLLLAPFDEVIFAGGTNETGSDPAALKAAAIEVWRAARARLPRARIIVLGSFVRATDIPTTIIVENNLKDAFTTWGDRNSAFVPLATAPVQMQTGGVTEASITGSITGTTLTVTNVATGALVIGQVLMAPGLLPETTITAGSGTSWTVSKSQTVSSRVMGAARPSNGNYPYIMGGVDGLDPTHPSDAGHDYFGSWLSNAIRAADAPIIGFNLDLPRLPANDNEAERRAA